MGLSALPEITIVSIILHFALVTHFVNNVLFRQLFRHVPCC